MTESKAYQSLIHKIDQFIRKYYWNKIIKGSLLVVGLNLFAFIAFNLLESQFYFGIATRKIFFYSMIGIFLASAYFWVLDPLLKWMKLGKTLSYDDAANIIGQHFSEVEDKLLNILHLSRQNDSSNNDLIYHSIEQKTEEIQWVPFPKAIDLKKNKKYLKYALPPVLVLVALLFSAPSLITNSSYRLIHNNREFVKEAPFSFDLQNEDLEIPQFEDITISLSTSGSVAPSTIDILLDGYQYKMTKDESGIYNYTLKNVGKDVDFSFLANGYQSIDYQIKVVKKPALIEMTMTIDAPDYTKVEDKVLKNPADVSIPQGSKITWNFDTENMSNLQFRFIDDQLDTLLNTSNNTAHFEKRIYKSSPYALTFNNSSLPNADSLQYFIETIPDQFPGISIEKHLDSQYSELIYILGDVSDDYGLTELSYNYAITSSNESPKFVKEVINQSLDRASTFQKVIDLSEISLPPGHTFQYYFEVLDNDRINGPKASKTSIQSWTQKTLEEFEEMEDATEETIKENLKKLVDDQKQLKKEAEELKNKLFQEKQLEWQHKKELENLIKKQEEIQKSLSETQKLQEQNQKNQSEFKEEQDPQNQQIQELMEQAQNPEMEKLMEKIKELMDKLKKDEAIEMLQEMDQQMNQSEMDMQRLEDLYEKLEMESDLQDAIDKLEKLAEEQMKLAEENQSKEEEMKNSEEKEENSSSEENSSNEENSNENSEESSDSESDKNDSSNQEKTEDNKENSPKAEQEKLNEKFEKLSEELEKLFEKNKEIKSPLDMEDPKTPSEEIKKDQQDASESLEKGDQNNSSQKQKDAAKKMEEMKQSMQNSMANSQEEQMQEDMALLRQILDNLVKLSFNQETLIEDINQASTTTPRYVQLVQEQFKLKNDFGLIQDSLLALANRNAQIQTAVTEKVNLIENHLDKSMDYLEEREKSNASNDQRRTMKNVNDLALLLSESLQNMQMSMSSSSANCNSPNKPGGEGNMPMDKISEGQQKMSEEMQKLAKEKQQGKVKGKGEGESMSKEFAQIAAQQAALRKMLEDKQRGLMEQGKGSKELQELIDLMDQMETDLVNKKLTNAMMKRQQEILTKLLEAEKAERQQELDEKRKSESAKQIPKTLPPDLAEYLEKRRADISPFKKLSPSLKPYYKRLVEEYYEQLKRN
ncbi:DUF4175 family protein [Membranihabitans marinus]|uniref:DUF4175 family protein n=1 Tax=Membranihabitans marinus TaxID=1227546 RepID=UPI001F419F96|nr:DUF4175 family protein [Membranihabitans marinus]